MTCLDLVLARLTCVLVPLTLAACADGQDHGHDLGSALPAEKAARIATVETGCMTLTIIGVDGTATQAADAGKVLPGQRAIEFGIEDICRATNSTIIGSRSGSATVITWLDPGHAYLIKPTIDGKALQIVDIGTGEELAVATIQRKRV